MDGANLGGGRGAIHLNNHHDNPRVRGETRTRKRKSTLGTTTACPNFFENLQGTGKKEPKQHFRYRDEAHTSPLSVNGSKKENGSLAIREARSTRSNDPGQSLWPKKVLCLRVAKIISQGKFGESSKKGWRGRFSMFTGVHYMDGNARGIIKKREER